MQHSQPSEEASSIDADDGVSHSSLVVDAFPGIKTIGTDSSSDMVQAMCEAAFNHSTNGIPEVLVILPSPISTITTRYVQVCFILLLSLLL
jgi:hypothetical protein